MSDEVEEFLGGYSPQVRDMALALREKIRALAPGANEKLYPGWRTIGYSSAGGMKSQFCAIGPQKLYVSIYFPQGTSLQDPAGLLEGTGKAMRHVKIKSAEAVDSPALADLIRQALALSAPANPATT